ncbi:catechol 2,3-dioxygenase-like lactoylglutathione lyase family enzyme [Gelidibacter algens]|uniref:Catechol 2,3-dioxygenase-like lactoylglutathione lyase family enzyme n=1 Tax=Gelidibacter algens TaxID=49280 RepID=A0A327S8V1_9FLAO|nr:VOC family protein [Gelidibacter algens]RAJ25105.1 catechol 2,3-dioxygenase-like lactoylglutathione lyase family enzyme [Gelidibacter algens]
MIKYTYTILYVENVTKSIEFYEKSFGFSRKFVTKENDYGEIITGETTISFASKNLANSNLKNGFIESDLKNKPFGIELGFVTENVAETIEKVKNNDGIIIEEPKQKPWGQIVAYIRDLDGFLIEICTSMG